MNKKVKAQITVYAALSVFLVITLICTCIRSAAVSAGRVRVEMASVLSMEAVFAGYSSELLEEFDIFALQESEQLQSVFLQYLKKNTQTAPEKETQPVEMPDDEVLYELADLFRVFGDSTRIKILYALHDSELCVQDIADAVQLSQSAVSHQLRVLKDSKLVRFRREGKTVFYALDDDHVRSILSMGMDHIEE